MNVQETTGTITEVGIRELTAAELDHVSGGQSGIEWMLHFIHATWVLACGYPDGYFG
jgi:hypothetical protein